MIEVILCVFGVYAITLVMWEYGGPFDIFTRLRAKFEYPFSCFVCTSFWVALIVACLSRLTFEEYFAVVGGAILIWKVGER